MKKVFFFDVDGTLLPHGNKMGIDKKTIQTLKELKENGHDVVIATGKAEVMVEDLIRSLNGVNHITSNGAQIVVNGELKHVERIAYNKLVKLQEIATENNFMMGCQKSDEYFLLDINFEEQKAKRILNAMSLNVPNVKKFTEDDVVNQVWFLGDNKSLNFDQEIIDKHRLIKWHPEGCDVVISYVSKAFAIKKYMEMMYPNTQTITYAFGDAANDIEMLKYVDNGIAMGNAIDDLKLVANEVTVSCEDLGVYKYLLEKKLIKE